MDDDSHPHNAQQPRLTSAADVDHIYRTLLHRPPENPTLGVGHSLVEYTLSVCTSAERRALLERELRERLSAANDLWVTKGEAGYFVTYAADQVIGNSIRTAGRFQEREINHALALLEKLDIPPRLTTFVDVGANIGTHTIWALRCGFQRCVCIEPDPGNFKLLRANQILNDVDAFCRNILAAASAEEGTMQLEISPVNFGDHRIRFSPSDGAYGESRWKTQNVSVKRLDALLADAEDLGLIWIDTQGHEGHVLAGAPRLLGLTTVPIVAEFWPYGLERAGGYEMLRALLSTSKRRIYNLQQESTDKPEQLDLIQLDELYTSLLRQDSIQGVADTNLLFV